MIRHSEAARWLPQVLPQKERRLARVLRRVKQKLRQRASLPQVLAQTLTPCRKEFRFQVPHQRDSPPCLRERRQRGSRPGEVSFQHLLRQRD